MNAIASQGKKNLLRNWIFWALIFITGFAIIIRSYPAWTNAAWGCDFGIYLGLTKTVSETGLIFPAYSGWGSSYNEFPVLYSINSIAHFITGIDILVIMPKLTPVFGGLSVLVFYFVARELINDKKIALISTLFFSVIPFHVYQTSHASPLTIGHFFMMVCMLFFLKFRKNSKYLLPLLISSILLIMSHHLTTYFYIIILIFIVFLENAKSSKWTKTFKKDILYLLLISATTFSYWAFVATTVYESFVRSGFSIGGIRIGSFFVILLFYILFFTMFWMITILRKQYKTTKKIKLLIGGVYNKIKLGLKTPFIIYNKKMNNEKVGEIYWYKKHNIHNRFFIKFSLTLISSVLVMVIFTVISIPWINDTFTSESIIFSFPFLVIISFGVAGFSYTWKMKNGLFICGWIIAVMISFVYAIISSNNILLPHRHIEYTMAPLAIIAVFGLGGIFSDPTFKKLLIKFKRKRKFFTKAKSKRRILSNKNPILQLFIILLIITSLSATPYLAHKTLNASDERITSENIAVFEWMDENLDKNHSLIASDHRLARMSEAYGFNTTKDETEELWEAESIDEYIDELLGIGKNHTRITHIIIDNIMKYDVVHVHFGEIRYMVNDSREDESKYASYDKFLKEPFNLIYRNESIELDKVTQEPIRWTEIFEVNWTYLEKNNYIH
ncbi:MAG: hypothetical protein AYK22_01550 [Thermoplasmatales archaeon SG8-52-3]|nr:MAG: hypothetical protein AYK22_01550 [Thermoplasmatales archaeon SG8-52-3]